MKHHPIGSMDFLQCHREITMIKTDTIAFSLRIETARIYDEVSTPRLSASNHFYQMDPNSSYDHKMHRSLGQYLIPTSFGTTSNDNGYIHGPTTPSLACISLTDAVMV